ncbi:hypothetical protein [Chryseolinea sp. H1M3-3]|uniref:hypothetical protein n=1 Tax=Chryseolinea sp. H1M3-3 TaxID=3034144 RepID=UPI0023EAE4A9|nr:hypothetical protein [Chryseolinea sp. H1M3-3]
MKLQHFKLYLVGVLLCGCQGWNGDADKIYESGNFKQYWYSGKAEINSYSLDQSRYGEQRSGKAVLIFVTEDFSKKKHVKLDDPSESESDKVSILKLNFTKNFLTGIYPYSMMQSVFTPVNREEYPHSLKSVMSAQEWCGQVFTQMNLRGNQFDVKSFSYFEKEGDANFSLKKMLIEDEIWNLIRLDHTELPTGEIDIIPGLFFSRLNHVDLKAQQAEASKGESNNLITYSISLPEQQRKLSIQFEKNFPYKILGWTEEFVERGKTQYTKASLDKTLVTDYWTKNKNEFQYLRDSLNLSSPQ